jgi:hypothetical protein
MPFGSAWPSSIGGHVITCNIEWVNGNRYNQYIHSAISIVGPVTYNPWTSQSIHHTLSKCLTRYNSSRTAAERKPSRTRTRNQERDTWQARHNVNHSSRTYIICLLNVTHGVAHHASLPSNANSIYCRVYTADVFRYDCVILIWPQQDENTDHELIQHFRPTETLSLVLDRLFLHIMYTVECDGPFSSTKFS